SEMFVSVGQSVAKGTRIGSVGSTGNSTGPHLHFEIRYHDVQRNPMGFLP
ncbi:MAG: M23 family metallopeptidase, partial [Anaerolineae bacterium]